MGSSRKSFLLNFFWSSAGFLTGIIRIIFLVPFFIGNWSEQMYGFWLVVVNFYAVSVYVIEGFSRYIINEYSKRFFSNRPEAYRYFGGGLRLLGVVVLICSLLLLLVLQFVGPVEKLFHINEEVITMHHLRGCIFMMFLLAGIHSVAKCIGYGIYPHGKVYVPERFIAVYTMVEAVIWALAATGKMPLMHLFGVYSVGLAAFSVVFAVNISRKYNFYKVIYFRSSLKGAWTNVPKSISLIVNNFCEKFTVEGMVFFVSAFFSAVMVPVYTTIRAMANFMVTGANMLVSTFTIEYQKLYVAKNGRSLLDLFNATWFLTGFIVNYGLIVFYPFLPDIYGFWTQGKLEFQPEFFDYVLAATICIVFGSNIIIYIKSINRIREMFFVAVVRAALLLVFLFIFPRQLVFVGLSLLIVEGLVNMGLLNVILYRELGKFQSGPIVGKLFWNTLPFFVTAVYVLTNRFIPIDGYLKMIIALAVVSVIYAIQISRVENEALLIRLQVLKYRIFGKQNK